LVDAPGESLDEGIERIAATPLDELQGEIGHCVATTGDPAWRAAERNPGRWLEHYTGTLRRAWTAFGPVWKRYEDGLARERERIALSTAMDAQLEFVHGLLAESAVRDGRWLVACTLTRAEQDFRRVRLPPSGLVLVPLVAGERASIVARVDTTIRHIGYPVRATLASADTSTGALEALLGIPRAHIMRVLERPATVGDLATGLRAVPSAATHHVTTLEAAGLVARERVGQRVLVERTELGHAVISLYDGAGRPRTRMVRDRAS
jgi:DNA-binding transcriptional ArsR family regulator